MKYAVVGTGYWGENHVRVAAELLDAGRLDEVVVCDADEDRAEDIADAYDLAATTDVADLAEYGVDAATVATPSPTHREVATTLLEGGVDLLVEKPLAMTGEDARKIVETADEQDCTLGVGHIFRYHPALVELKSRIDRGELGEIKHLHTNRFSFRVPRESAGVVFSLAVHDVDIYNYLLDRRPDRLYCQRNSYVRDDVDETATVLLEFGETTGVINSSWQIPVFGKRRDLVVVGTERTAYLDYLADTELELYESRVDTSGEGGPTARDEGATVYEAESYEPLKREVEDFVRSSREGTRPRASGAVGVETVELLERIEESAERDRAVPVESAGGR